MEKVWHLYHFSVQDNSVSARDRYTKEFEQLNYVLVRGFHLLLEENQDNLVNLSDCLVDG